MKTLGISSTGLGLALGIIALCAQTDGFLSGLLSVPITLGPLLISLAFAITWRKQKKAQVALMLSTVLFMLWFAFVYVDVFYWHPDAQSPIALIFAGIYSLPVMIVAWVVASRLREPARAHERHT